MSHISESSLDPRADASASGDPGLLDPDAFHFLLDIHADGKADFEMCRLVKADPRRYVNWPNEYALEVLRDNGEWANYAIVDQPRKSNGFDGTGVSIRYVDENRDGFFDRVIRMYDPVLPDTNPKVVVDHYYYTSHGPYDDSPRQAYVLSQTFDGVKGAYADYDEAEDVRFTATVRKGSVAEFDVIIPVKD